MICVEKKQMPHIAFLFAEWQETMVLSCLQGHMGCAWVDDLDRPTCAQILSGDFCFYTGDFASPEAPALVANIPSSYSGSDLFMIPENSGWGSLIETVHNGKLEKFQRYAIKKEGNCFDKALLQSFADSLPSEYKIERIDRDLYQQSFQQQWSHDFCSLFASAQDYIDRGIGFCVTHHGKMVCGASSYSVYDDGIEIEIATDPAYRRKGLATACGAKLILACLENHKYPSWDAANMNSVRLSEKLGYHFDKAYDAYKVSVE